MGFIFLSPHLHWGASPTGLVVANLNCLWMSIGQCCLPPLTGAAAVGGMKFGFSFSWSGERKDCHLWDSAGNATVFFFLPTLCEESQYSRFYLMKRLFTTWLCLLQLCTFKSLFWFWFVVFFSSVKAKKICLVSFCLLYKISASTYSLVCSRLHLPLVLLPLVPFSYPTCTAFLHKTVSLSEVPFKRVHQTTPNLSDNPHCETESPSYSRSSRNNRQLAELK